MIRILLGNDQELSIAGLKKEFDSEADLDLIGVATNFEDTLLLAKQYQPDIVLFDYLFQENHCMMHNGDCVLKEGNNIERIPELLSACPSSKILILTACLNQERHLLALRQGAVGVFLLNQPIVLLKKAIQKIMAGEVWFPHSLAKEIFKNYKRPDSKTNDQPVPGHSALTRRELTIARHLAQGNHPQKVAELLFVSEKTIRNNMTTIYSKLGIHSQIELVLNPALLGDHDSNFK